MSARLPKGKVRERVLGVAEDLFAAGGLDGVSFRDLTESAGVSLSAIHYHFGSKLGLLSEVFARSAKPLADRRIQLLSQIPRDPKQPHALEKILEAFLRPAFEMTRGDGSNTFNRLRARVSLENTAAARRILSEAFDESDNMFIDALAEILPRLSRVEIYWRFHFLVGAMIYAMADQGQLAGLSQGAAHIEDTEGTLRRIVPFFAAAFLVPEPDAESPSTWQPSAASTG